MKNLATKKHNIALIMLSATAIVWGAGFLLSDTLLTHGFRNVPFTLNALRFGCAALVLVAVFCTKIKLSKQLLLYGSVGGVFLFCGFALQLIGLKYTTPASCGFFTASYSLFVPLICWIFFKKRPSWIVGFGIISALAGLLILNVPNGNAAQGENELLGNMLALGGSLFFAIQIIWADRALKDKGADSLGMTVVQIVVCAIAFVISALVLETKSYSSLQIDWSVCWWTLAIVTLAGTAFAYFAQTFAQSHLASTETSLIIACESPIGAILSVALGADVFSWQICVGGFFVLLAVVLVEILPSVLQKKAQLAVTSDGETLAEQPANDQAQPPQN